MAVWDQCISFLKGDLTTAEYNTWILPLQAAEENSRIRLYAPNRFVKEWVRQHYEQRIVDMCEHLSDGRIGSVAFEIGSSSRRSDRNSPPGNKATSSAVPPAMDQAEVLARRSACNLSEEFTFDTFVEGKSNQIARAASIQIGKNPGSHTTLCFCMGASDWGRRT